MVDRIRAVVAIVGFAILGMLLSVQKLNPFLFPSLFFPILGMAWPNIVLVVEGIFGGLLMRYLIMPSHVARGRA